MQWNPDRKAKYIYIYITRLLRRFTTILYCLFIYVHCKRITKKFADCIKKIRGFKKFNENRILLEANFWNFDRQTFPGPDLFSRFDVYWIYQRNKQTDTQTSKVYTYIYMKPRTWDISRIDYISVSWRDLSLHIIWNQELEIYLG